MSGEEPLAALRARLADFVRARDWSQFHQPKDLALCLSVEASELLELYLWRRSSPPFPPGTEPPMREDLEGEVADIFISLLNFCAVTGIDPVSAAQKKIDLLELRYSVERARGSAEKLCSPPEDALPETKGAAGETGEAGEDEAPKGR